MGYLAKEEMILISKEIIAQNKKEKYKFKVSNSRFGKGCFAIEPIKKGETICFFEGEETSWNESERRYLDGRDRVDDPLQLSESKFLYLFEPYIYFNHSCNPKSGLRGGRELIAIRDIIAGEEITYDYSSVTWDDRWTKIQGAWTMKCECRERNCRKAIGDFLTIPKSQRVKYLQLGIVPNFIIEKLVTEKKNHLSYSTLLKE